MLLYLFCVSIYIAIHHASSHIHTLTERVDAHHYMACLQHRHHHHLCPLRCCATAPSHHYVRLHARSRAQARAHTRTKAPSQPLVRASTITLEPLSQPCVGPFPASNSARAVERRAPPPRASKRVRERACAIGWLGGWACRHGCVCGRVRVCVSASRTWTRLLWEVGSVGSAPFSSDSLARRSPKILYGGPCSRSLLLCLTYFPAPYSFQPPTSFSWFLRTRAIVKKGRELWRRRQVYVPNRCMMCHEGTSLHDAWVSRVCSCCARARRCISPPFSRRQVHY